MRRRKKTSCVCADSTVDNKCTAVPKSGKAYDPMEFIRTAREERREEKSANELTNWSWRRREQSSWN